MTRSKEKMNPKKEVNLDMDDKKNASDPSIDESEDTLEEQQTAPQEEENYKNKYFLLLADMENARKRLAKEKQDLIRFALDDLLLDFLSPLDTLEQSLGFCKNMSPEIQNWALGFQMILDQFHDILKKNSVQPFKSVGSTFDPHKHEAIETVESTEHPEGYIIEEVLCGYLRRDKVLRAARVKVVTNKASSKNEDANN